VRADGDAHIICAGGSGARQSGGGKFWIFGSWHFDVCPIGGGVGVAGDRLDPGAAVGASAVADLCLELARHGHHFTGDDGTGFAGHHGKRIRTSGTRSASHAAGSGDHGDGGGVLGDRFLFYPVAGGLGVFLWEPAREGHLRSA